MPNKRKPNLPAVGAAFAFRLADGRFSVCRVLLDASSQQSKRWRGAETFLVAGSAWIGAEVPRADEPALRPILHLSHHAHKNCPSVVWISAEPPHDLIPIGIIEPTAEEQAIDCWAWGGWASITLPPLTQWRWDHEREAVLAEDAIKRQKQLEARQQAQKEREQRRKRTTLDDLRKHQFFRNWKGHPPAKAIRASRKVMKSTVEELFKLGPLASENQRLAVLQQCIESFNALDSEMHFIATIEREDICEEFEAIVDACGLGAHKDLADEWREW